MSQAAIERENLKKSKVRQEMNEIRNKYEQFKHDSIREEAMRAFAKYMKDKMISKQYKKEKKRDLGLAAVDTHVIFT